MTIRTMTTVFAVAGVIALAACDDKTTTTTPTTTTTSTTTPAAAPVAAATPTPTAEPTAADLERAKLAAMKNVYADEAAWNKGCVDDKVDAKICDCAGKAVVKTIGVKGLYAWVWQAYVNRDATARMRSNSWFTDNQIDKVAQQKFADAVGKCYTL